MAKICPETLLSNPSLPSSTSPQLYSSRLKQVFTVWMKSLVLHGNGCTVYDSDNKIVYRVDNYGHKCRDEVYVMDATGNDIIKLTRKTLGVFGRWKGYRCEGSQMEGLRPCFRVKKPCRILKRNSPIKFIVGLPNGLHNSYTLDGLASKSSYKITDQSGELVAEVKPKHTASGIGLGDDILTLVVEPNVDFSLIMGMMVSYSLINRFM